MTDQTATQLSAWGKDLADRRVKAGLTQTEVGNLADCSGTHIGALENGRRAPSKRLASALTSLFEGLADPPTYQLSRTYKGSKPRSGPSRAAAEMTVMGRHIERVRRERGETIDQFARRAGVHPSTISNARYARTATGKSTIEAIAKACDMTPTQLRRSAVPDKPVVTPKPEPEPETVEDAGGSTETPPIEWSEPAPLGPAVDPTSVAMPDIIRHWIAIRINGETVALLKPPIVLSAIAEAYPDGEIHIEAR